MSPSDTRKGLEKISAADFTTPQLGARSLDHENSAEIVAPRLVDHISKGAKSVALVGSGGAIPTLAGRVSVQD